MVSESGGAAPAAVVTGPVSRRRRAFRLAAVAVGLGWLAVIVLVIVGLTIPGAPRTAAAGTPAVTATHPAAKPTTHPTAQPTVHPAVGSTVHRTVPAVPAVPKPPRLSGHQLSETSKEFATAPLACAPARKCADLGCRRSLVAPVKESFGSVQAAFDGDGVALPDEPSPGNFDCGGFSYQAQQLVAEGFGPGDKVAVAGKVLTLPQVPLGAPDEVTARGQVIHLPPASGPAAELGFLGAGEFGTQSGTVTITYAGGSKQTETLRLADWYSDVAAPGSVIAASAQWNVPPSQSFGPAPVSVYYAQVRLDPSKRAVSVTLPRDPNLHLFDIGVPSAAAYSTISSAYNDTGLAAATAAGDANYDGAGHSYSSSALAARGLRPGASVTAHGVKFTWPSYGTGHLDNIRTQGQTIAITGAGRVLGFLGAATLGTQRGTVTIQYSNGSTQTVTLSLADWRANRAASGGTVVATVPWNQIPGAGHHLVSVYAATVPLEKGKTVVSVTLPVNIDMHVFAIAEGK
jgi:hypothetical protein